MIQFTCIIPKYVFEEDLKNMALDKFKNFLSGKEETGNDEEYYNDDGNIDNENKMILLEPRAYSESQQIVYFLQLV